MSLTNFSMWIRYRPDQDAREFHHPGWVPPRPPQSVTTPNAHEAATALIHMAIVLPPELPSTVTWAVRPLASWPSSFPVKLEQWIHLPACFGAFWEGESVELLY